LAKTRIFIFSSFENRRLGGEIATRSKVNFVNEQTKTKNLSLPAADKIIALLSSSKAPLWPFNRSAESPLKGLQQSSFKLLQIRSGRRDL